MNFSGEKQSSMFYGAHQPYPNHSFERELYHQGIWSNGMGPSYSTWSQTPYLAWPNVMYNVTPDSNVGARPQQYVQRQTEPPYWNYKGMPQFERMNAAWYRSNNGWQNAPQTMEPPFINAFSASMHFGISDIPISPSKTTQGRFPRKPLCLH